MHAWLHGCKGPLTQPHAHRRLLSKDFSKMTGLFFFRICSPMGLWHKVDGCALELRPAGYRRTSDSVVNRPNAFIFMKQISNWLCCCSAFFFFPSPHSHTEPIGVSVSPFFGRADGRRETHLTPPGPTATHLNHPRTSLFLTSPHRSITLTCFAIEGATVNSLIDELWLTPLSWLQITDHPGWVSQPCPKRKNGNERPFSNPSPSLLQQHFSISLCRGRRAWATDNPLFWLMVESLTQY